ncbi:unnamed protein product, partial [Allacma fusca]
MLIGHGRNSGFALTTIRSLMTADVVSGIGSTGGKGVLIIPDNECPIPFNQL